MHIVNLDASRDDLVHGVAALLFEVFRELSPESWPTLADALAEVRDSLDGERISRVAVDDSGTVLGWIGGIPEYDGRVWELHPLVVAPTFQHRGIGRALVGDLEAGVRRRGGITLWAGSDDELGQTSLAGVDLYDDLPRHLANVKNLRGHPFEFYQRLGFTIVGVVPDANGPGKPDILLAKRVAPAEST